MAILGQVPARTVLPVLNTTHPPGEVELGVSLWVRCLAPGSSGIAWVLREEFRLLDRVAPVPYPTGDSTLERKKAVRRAAKIFIYKLCI